jgi:DNA-binding response OmpR family regulator
MSTATDPEFMLVVEDQPTTLQTIVTTLTKGGFAVHTAMTRAEVLAEVETGRCLAIVLDLGLPGDDGVHIAKAVREWSNVPIVMLTGRVKVHERIAGLEAGADDYLIKPFDPGELLARLKAILRRTAKAVPPLAPVVSAAIGPVRFDIAGRALTGPLGKAALTMRETSLLLALCTYRGALSRPAAYREVFRRDWDPGDRSLDVHVANVRRKFETVSGDDDLIVTVRGEGYKILKSVQLERAELV